MTVKAKRITRPLHWSLEHYPYYPVWGSLPERWETRMEAYQHCIAAAAWYNNKRMQMYHARQLAKANGYRKLANDQYAEAEVLAGRCK